MFNLLKYKINIPFFNKKNLNNIDDNDVYILEDSNAEYYENNQSNYINNDIIIDIPILEDLDNSESSTYKNDSNNINHNLRDNTSQNNKTLFNMLQEHDYQRQSIYRFVKPRRLYKKYNYKEYPFYNYIK